MRNRKLVMLPALLIIVSALIFAALSGTMAEARGGRGGGKGGSGTTSGTATCSVTPNPVALWGYITVSGSGFAPYTSVGYAINSSQVGGVITDSSGSFSTLNMAIKSGTNTVSASGGGKSASCTFNAY